MNEFELKNCPFCDGEADFCHCDDGLYQEKMYIKCKECFSRTDKRSYWKRCKKQGYVQILEETKLQLTKLWNKRA